MHIRSARGLSKGRNCGLTIARGEILATPDDDCWYPPELLGAVQQWFSTHPDFHGLSTSVRDETGQLQGPRRRGMTGCECDRHSIWHYGISFNSFLRRQVIDAVGSFDESLGVGADTIYQSGEETDYFLRGLACGYRFWYRPELSVYHPSLREIQRILRQAYPYALGTGYVLRKHGYSVFNLCKDFLLYSFAGAAVAFCRMNLGVARVRTRRGMGQLVGFLRSAKASRNSRQARLPGSEWK